MDLVLIRHPPVDIAPGTCYGQLDVPLAPGWEPLLDALKTDLLRKTDHVFSSPSSRCVLPAQRWGILPVHFSPDLMELHFGTWEGQRWDDIPSHELNPWMEAYWKQRPPDGETMPELRHRVLRWIQHARNLPSNRVLVFTHAGVIRTLIGILDNLPPQKLFNIEVPHLQPFNVQL